MQPEVSISVPVYNVAKFIEKCARSLFEQTFQPVEYIFVNDATPDNSIALLLNIIEQYPERKENVRIVNHEVNRGLAAARKTGFSNSSGKYIMTVDSDDYIEPDTVELMYNKAIENHADIVVADIIKEYPDGKVQIECYEHSDDIETCRLNVLIAVKSPNYLCGKLIAKRLFDNELFVPVPDGQNYWEDRFVLTQLYFFTDKIAKVDKPLYHYIQYNSSAISAQSRRRMHFENAFTFWTFLEDFLSKRQVYDKYKDVIDFEKVKHKASMMISTSSNALRKEFADKYYQEETKYYSQLKKGKKIITFLNRHKLFVLSQAYHYGVCFVKSIKK